MYTNANIHIYMYCHMYMYQEYIIFLHVHIAVDLPSVLHRLSELQLQWIATGYYKYTTRRKNTEDTQPKETTALLWLVSK